MEMPRAMMFIDGENLCMRYQALLAEGKTPKADVQHEEDCYVWHGDMTATGFFNFSRVNYYTSVVGDDEKVSKLKETMGRIKFICQPETRPAGSSIRASLAQIVPFVFKKDAKSRKSRNVDIAIIIDIMRHSYSNMVDLIFLVSGDGDYLPLIKEVMRHGKRVYAGAFSSGLNRQIPYSVDHFFELDKYFFK